MKSHPQPFQGGPCQVVVLSVGVLLACTAAGFADETSGTATASESAAETSPAGALDGDRFSTTPGALWKGTAAQAWWQFSFAAPTDVGAILQINGDDPHLLTNAPRNYAWQISQDGQTWRTLPETVVHSERRMFRIHRLRAPVSARHLRLMINLSLGAAPSIREIEFYPTTDAAIPWNDWIVAVSSVEEPESAGIGMRFVDLARECEGWKDVQAQCVWHGDFDPEFVTVEPRPLCAFLSGSYLEWCQCAREPWRGVQQVLTSRRLPMWGACGGAQILAILDETGVDAPWDCPRCRDPQHPLSPVYSHIGHLGPAPCGDYNQSVGERGLFEVQVVAHDPVFQGLPQSFTILESHIGQIDYVPSGWTRIVTKGPNGHTDNQCLRVNDCPIYSAQFHMESYADTKSASIPIMSNFLRLAKEWGGYNPQATPLPTPDSIGETAGGQPAP